jgi:hypothetical protein
LSFRYQSTVYIRGDYLSGDSSRSIKEESDIKARGSVYSICHLDIGIFNMLASDVAIKRAIVEFRDKRNSLQEVLTTSRRTRIDKSIRSGNGILKRPISLS